MGLPQYIDAHTEGSHVLELAPAGRSDGVRRLAQYRPFERGGLDLQAVLHDLVIAVAAIQDGEVESLFECSDAFKGCWSLEVEIDEIRPIVEGIVEKGLAEKRGKGFRLNASLMGELNTRARQSQQTEDRALREWELTVRQLRPTLSVGDMDLLRNDLLEWLHLIIARHGAEAAMMLYPEDERARRFFDEVDARGFDTLPDRNSDVARLRKEALPLFIREPTPDQRRFLAGLLNTSFYMTVLTIDPGAKKLVQEQMKGHRVYLDTNFLYAVLGAAPPEEVYSARRLVQMSRDLGFEMAITPWTMDELRTSIARSRRDIERNDAFVRPELAETMLRASGDKGFSRFFWQIYNDTKTKPKDVFDRLDHFDRDLADFGLHEVTEGCTAVEQQEERIRDYSSLLNSERWPYQKEWVVLEHDAKCRLLVERLRGAGNLRFSNARFWFLTYDSKLPRFADRIPDNGDLRPSLPFCISPSAWVQVIRALTPRTEDFERTVVDLLTSPFVGYRRAVNPGVVSEVVGRMDHLEDASPEMALAVLTDTAKVQQIETAVASDGEEAVEETVRAAFSTKAREMEVAVTASEQRAAEALDARQEAERRATEAEAARIEQHERSERAQRTLAQEREERALEKSQLEAEVVRAEQAGKDAAGKAEARIETVEARIELQERVRRRNLRIATGLAVMTLGAAVALLVPLLLVPSSVAVVGSVVGGAALLLVGIRVLAGPKWGGEIAKWGGLLLAIAGIAVAIAVSGS